MKLYRTGVIALVAATIAACSAKPPADTSAAASGAAAGAAGFQQVTLNGKPCLKIPVDKIGIQLWAVQTLFKVPPGTGLNAVANPDDIDKGLAQVAAIGYKNVEGYSGYGLPADQFKALLDKHGLHQIASHTQVTDKDWDKTLDYAVAMGQKYIGSSLPPEPGVETLDNLKQMIKNVNALGERAAAKGLKLYLHNHTTEFEHQYMYDINKDGHPVMTPAWEIVFAETDPRYVWFETDVNWLFRGLQGIGRDKEIADFIQKHSDRIILMHIKEPNSEPPPSRGEVDVGSGNVIDWPTIYKAGKNVDYYIYEYDAPPDAVKSATAAFKYMTCQA